jgi:hypothetical protein
MSTSTEHRSIPIDQIRTNDGTQMRSEIDKQTVEDYARLYGDRLKLPPVVVFKDGCSTWLAYGFHRLQAAREAGMEDIPAEIHKGDRRDAILCSVAANATCGLRRTNADKRRAVEALVKDEEWSQ